MHRVFVSFFAVPRALNSKTVLMFAFTNVEARRGFVRAVCVIAEGADAPVKPPVHAASRPHAVLHAVLRDAQRRVAALGGRAGMPRSVGSLMAAHIVLFLGSTFRGRESTTIATPDADPGANGISVSRDGCTVLVAKADCKALVVYCARTGALLRTIGGGGSGPLQFNGIRQVFIASDEFVFVADSDNSRIQILTPCLGFHGIVGAGQLRYPVGVCADADVIAVSDIVVTHGGVEGRINVFGRDSWHLLRHIASQVLHTPLALCFMSDHRAVAVTDQCRDCVFVLTLDGRSVRRVGVGRLSIPYSIACSSYDELIVTDDDHGHIAVFDSEGVVRKTIACGVFTSVHVHNSVLFTATCFGAEICVVYS
jgi:hypothetical protein